jgi:hypothetical protein
MVKKNEQRNISLICQAKASATSEGLEGEVRSHNTQTGMCWKVEAFGRTSDWLNRNVVASDQPLKTRSAAEIEAAEHKLDEFIRYCQRLKNGRTDLELLSTDYMADSRFEEMAAYHGYVHLCPEELAYLKGRLSALRWVQGHELNSPEDDLYLK